MRKQIRQPGRTATCFLLLIFMALIASACDQSSTPTPIAPPSPIASPTPAASVIVAAATPAVTASPPTNTSPALTATLSRATLPALLYLNDGTLFEQPGTGEPHRLGTVPISGTVLGVTSFSGTVLMLTTSGLDLVKISDGSTSALVRFDQPAAFGTLGTPAQDGAVIYNAVFDRPGASGGMVSRIGVYEGATVRELPPVQGAVLIVGVTTDGSGLYRIPRGQDPSFGKVEIVSLDNGNVLSTLPIEGYGGAFLSPDGRYMVTMANPSPNGALWLYDLTVQPLNANVVMLPVSGSYVGGLVWAPDSRSHFFNLSMGDPNFPGESRGLWRLDMPGQALAQIAVGSAMDSETDLVAISPDSRWLLLRRPVAGTVRLVNILTGESSQVMIPDTAIIAGWR